MVKAWIWRSAVQGEALDQVARTINDVEPPSVPFARGRGILMSEFLDGLEGMDQSHANVRHFEAILITDYFMAIGEIEVIA
jgi:hypothetical protein